MKGAQIVQVLANTLSPLHTNSSLNSLSQFRDSHGFGVELLLIADDSNYQIEVRLSALIYLKNMLYDHCEKNTFIPSDDVEIIKSNLLLALIRNFGNSKLTPTFRQIVFILASKYYPRQWPVIGQQIIKYLNESGDLNQLGGSIEALKAIYSVFGKAISKQIELSNLCNRTVISLLTLASKLFQNYSNETSIILIGIFKIFATSIYFSMPSIVEKNIHNWMIFVKKILDLNVNLEIVDNNSMYILKKICLRILFRIYQRHVNSKITSNKQFALNFQKKYTKPFVQTLILQIVNEANFSSKKAKKHLQLTKLSISTIAYIYRQNAEAAMLINGHWSQILNLCLQRFKINVNKQYSSFTEYKLQLQGQRLYLKQLLFSYMRSEALPQEQTNNVQSLLSILFECVQRGDNDLKELALYIFSEISSEIQNLNESLDYTMVTFIIEYIKPLLADTNHVMLRARACNLISSYSYLQLPLQHLQSMAESIYTCFLTPGKDEKELYLKIYACNAFNSLLKYDPIIEYIKPFLKNILQIYTSLLQADVTVIKNFEDLLNLLEEELAPYNNGLIELLINMFKNYAKLSKDRQAQGYINFGNNKQTDDDDQDDQQIYDENEGQSNNDSIAKACVSSIRQVLQISDCDLSQSNSQLLFQIVIWIFSDTEQHFIQQGFNILNLLLYKCKGNIQNIYHFLLKVIIYAILGIPQGFMNKLKSKGDSLSLKQAQIFQNICSDPDIDIIENSIGCLRNFIAKINPNDLRNIRDQYNISYMDYILRVVKTVHENHSQNVSQTDRSIILTVYITLIEYNVVNEFQLENIVNSIVAWMRMQEEAVEQSNKKEQIKNLNLKFQNKRGQQYIYIPIYLQILLLIVHFYPQFTNKSINFNLVILKIVSLLDSYKCDYQLSRIIICFSDLLTLNLITDVNICTQFMSNLPNLVKRICQLRQDGDNPKNDIGMDDEAEEQQFFGEDENSHLIGWQQKGGATSNDMLLCRKDQDDELSDNEWQEEFNKFYLSPLDQIDELKYLENSLKGPASSYLSCMDIKSQEDLSLYLMNAPPKLFT